MCIYKGLPSIYFTIANDVKGVFQIRMSTPFESNQKACFPSDSDLFLKDLWEGNKECVGINVENIALGNLINSHPVFETDEFPVERFIRYRHATYNEKYGTNTTKQERRIQ